MASQLVNSADPAEDALIETAFNWGEGPEEVRKILLVAGAAPAPTPAAAYGVQLAQEGGVADGTLPQDPPWSPPRRAEENPRCPARDSVDAPDGRPMLGFDRQHEVYRAGRIAPGPPAQQQVFPAGPGRGLSPTQPLYDHRPSPPGSNWTVDRAVRTVSPPS